MGQTLPVVTESSANAGDFFFALTEEGKGLQEEGYRMTVDEKVAVEAETTTGAFWATRTSANAGDFFFALTEEGKGLQEEGYRMTVDEKVAVEAETTTGAFWATRTILQSLKAAGNIPQGIARDYPLYKVRGFILDVGRKTFTMDWLEDTVKQMSWYKMNDFQIHLNGIR